MPLFSWLVSSWSVHSAPAALSREGASPARVANIPQIFAVGGESRGQVKPPHSPSAMRASDEAPRRDGDAEREAAEYHRDGNARGNAGAQTGDGDASEEQNGDNPDQADLPGLKFPANGFRRGVARESVQFREFHFTLFRATLHPPSAEAPKQAGVRLRPILGVRVFGVFRGCFHRRCAFWVGGFSQC